MEINISTTKKILGCRAAARGAELIRQALAARGQANIIVATGASQFEMLSALVRAQGIRWSAVTAFHLDEYVGLPIEHPASFRRYLWTRFVSRLPLPLAAFNCVNGEGDPAAECERLGRLIRRHPIDVAFVGIGENGHLAFNDPPADFDTRKPYLVVELDTACRRQQLGEGWFPNLAAVPKRAISMSIRQIMQARAIVCTVPDARKAAAVHDCLSGPVTNRHPASILQRHPACSLWLDRDSSARLK